MRFSKGASKANNSETAKTGGSKIHSARICFAIDMAGIAVLPGFPTSILAAGRKTCFDLHQNFAISERICAPENDPIETHCPAEKAWR